MNIDYWLIEIKKNAEGTGRRLDAGEDAVEDAVARLQQTPPKQLKTAVNRPVLTSVGWVALARGVCE